MMAGTHDNDEEFSWEDEDEETSPTTKAAPQDPAVSASNTPPIPESQQAHLSPSTAATRSRVSTPGNLSPRQSSEDSYDVVSSQVSTSGAAEASTDTVATAKAAAARKSEEGGGDQEESEDSDWE